MILHAAELFRHECNKTIKDKFNGDVVSNITGFVNKELGAFMQELINAEGGKQLLWPKILHASNDVIKAWVMYQRNCFLKTKACEREIFSKFNSD
jgi:hypothetical protein